MRLAGCTRLTSLQGHFPALQTLYLGACGRLCDSKSLGAALKSCHETLSFLSLVDCHSLSTAGLKLGFPKGFIWWFSFSKSIWLVAHFRWSWVFFFFCELLVFFVPLALGWYCRPSGGDLDNVFFLRHFFWQSPRKSAFRCAGRCSLQTLVLGGCRVDDELCHLTRVLDDGCTLRASKQ